MNQGEFFPERNGLSARKPSSPNESMSDAGTPRLFALQASRDFGSTVSEALGVPLSEHEERDFEDGEHKARPLVSVRGRDVFVVQSLYGDPQESVNDKLCRLLFFIGALKDASAERVTAVVPYLCYARKDRKTKSRDPVTTRYVAALFEAVGADGLVTIDVHNLSAYQNAFRCRTEHLEAYPLFTDYFAPLLDGQEVVVMSPDVGGVKRAEPFREALSQRLGREVPMAFMEKQRSGGGISGEAFAGPIEGRTVLLLDDLISTGTTLARAAQACHSRGARAVHAAATHGLFVGEASRTLAEAPLEQIVITDTVPPFRLETALVEEKLVRLDAAPLMAAAVQHLHTGRASADLLEG